MLHNALTFSHKLLSEVIQPGDLAIDATVGNGHDTLFLANLVGTTGKVYGFDIQEEGLNRAKKRLTEEAVIDRTILFHQGHETVGEILPLGQPLSAAIFNLGYLPRSNKSLVTRGPTTIMSISKILPHLKLGGRILVVTYCSHEGGHEEKDMLVQYASSLPQKTYTSLSYHFINQQNDPPTLIAIERKK